MDAVLVWARQVLHAKSAVAVGLVVSRSQVLARCKVGANVTWCRCCLRLVTCGASLPGPMRLLWAFSSSSALVCVRMAAETSACGCSAKYSSAEVSCAPTLVRAGAASASVGDVSGGEGGAEGYGLPVIGRCNYRPVITAVITVITTALFQLPVIGQDKPSVRVPSPADTRAAARQSHLQGHVTEEMALTAPR